MFLLCGICSVVLLSSGLDLAYYVCIISSWEVFILKRHDISLTRNGAEVFICWFDDCLSNITWNKTISTRTGVCFSQFLFCDCWPSQSLHCPQSQMFTNPAGTAHKTSHTALVEETNHSWLKNSISSNLVSNKFLWNVTVHRVEPNKMFSQCSHGCGKFWGITASWVWKSNKMKTAIVNIMFSSCS